LDIGRIRRLVTEGRYGYSKHAVCTIKTEPEELFLITVYDPSKRPDKWTENYRKRR